MRFACWITEATDAHPEYVIIITFLRQKKMVTRRRLDVQLYANRCFVVVLVTRTSGFRYFASGKYFEVVT
jgi:hypothetical protein